MHRHAHKCPWATTASSHAHWRAGGAGEGQHCPHAVTPAPLGGREPQSRPLGGAVEERKRPAPPLLRVPTSRWPKVIHREMEKIKLHPAVGKNKAMTSAGLSN